jgi:hypothetical protein
MCIQQQPTDSLKYTIDLAVFITTGVGRGKQFVKTTYHQDEMAVIWVKGGSLVPFGGLVENGPPDLVSSIRRIILQYTTDVVKDQVNGANF